MRSLGLAESRCFATRLSELTLLMKLGLAQHLPGNLDNIKVRSLNINERPSFFIHLLRFANHFVCEFGMTLG